MEVVEQVLPPVKASAHPLHVVVINDFGHVNGGAAQVAISAAVGLRRRGLRVTFFCAVAPIDASLMEAGVDVVCLGQSDILTNPSRANAAVTGLWNRQAKLALASLLRNSPSPTIVHVHGWSKALSTSVYEALAESGVPHVSTQHEFFAVCPNGGLYDYRAKAICHLKPMSFSCVSRNCDVRSYAHKGWRVVRQAVARSVSGIPAGLQNVIYLSEIARRAATEYMHPRTHWHYVRNPVVSEPCERAHAENNPNFIFVGRLAAEKGADLFLEAAERAGVSCTVVGDGDMRQDLQERYPNARFTGWLSSDVVRLEIRKSRALVFPSRWYETFGLTALEALAQGIPAIVANGTAAADVIVDGENGHLFEQGDIDELSRVLQVLRSDEHVKRLSECAHSRYWSDPPTVDAHVEALLRVFDVVLESAPGKGLV